MQRKKRDARSNKKQFNLQVLQSRKEKENSLLELEIIFDVILTSLILVSL